MADKLLIRLFDVGLGDCIYCCVPKAHIDGRDFHILIDCGTLSSTDLLATAVGKLRPLLPLIDGKRRIDLLVVTHEHKDHMTGFGLKLWDDFSFGAIWMNAAMDLNHPEAEKAKKLHAFAAGAMAQAVRLNLALGPGLQELASAVALNKDAMTTLRETLPNRSKIKPIYVHADSTKADLKLPLNGASISVLGPERDIDFFYLGDPGDPSLRSALRFVEAGLPSVTAAVPAASDIVIPKNIDPADFRQLRSRMLSTALAFADLDGKVCNNTSVVLLLEWGGKRLLFVGDAEWDQGFKKGKGNCAWNVMWNLRKQQLDGPLAFLKIGHHGSVNATPWQMPGASKGEPLAILDSILPVDSKAMAKAVVSTRRGNYETIPRSDLLVEIGRRVSNTKNYQIALRGAGIPTSNVPKFAEFESESFAKPQPLRTDLERLLGSKGFVDVEIDR
ncbi:metallohydrolase [Mesorhizobium sp. WSM3860]|uniref:metallohydrolase n=1 Tax=Mesorhizobium sp. WSM3860 TaxID=2029403 RepID=UPI000BAF99C2|nr:metallohydrolase [Mesorhizobium sp. WSM3860]PBC01431.1 metallohydrolase [Mesorhizobium sp. WSM3860]